MGKIRQEGSRQQDDIVFAFPQGGDGDRDDPETIIEVFPEEPFLDGLRQIPVGGGEDPHIDRRNNRMSTTETGFF